MFCEDCLSITKPETGLFPGLQRRPEAYARDKNVFQTVFFSIDFKPSWVDLENSAKVCECCRFLYDNAYEIEQESDDKIATPIQLTREFKRFDIKPLEQLSEGDCIRLHEISGEYPTAVKFYISSTELSNTWDYGITRRPVAQDSGSAQAFNYIRDRLQDCEQNHRNCSISEETYIPTRLLDVNIPNQPDIIQLKGRHELGQSKRYIALSYCWGLPSKKPLSTLTSNIEAHREAIPLEELPKTFRDAVVAARALNIRYIWIDSLCIVQDNDSEWESESACMADIYKNAYLTIAASTSSDSHGGLIGKRNLHLRRWNSREMECNLPLYFKLPSAEPWVNGRMVYLQRHPTSGHPNGLINYHSKSPLMQRAWALQEQILSRRTIFYESHQFLWECEGGRWLEGWNLELQTFCGEDRLYPFAATERLFANVNISQGLDPRFPDQKYTQWYLILREFTKRLLTYDTDALPAMSGLARVFASRTGDIYMMGIWRNDVFRGLSWFCDKGVMGRPKSTESSAPSWSWAALPSGSSISWSSSLSSRSFRWHRPDSFLPDAQSPRLISTDTIAPNSDYMGRIRSGRLVLEGPCRTVMVTPRDSKEHHPYGQQQGKLIFEVDGFQPKHLNQFVYPYIDYPDSLDQGVLQAPPGKGVILTCFLLGRTEQLHCLLLNSFIEENRVQIYRRIGVLNIQIRDEDVFYSGWEQRRLTIA